MLRPPRVFTDRLRKRIQRDFSTIKFGGLGFWLWLGFGLGLQLVQGLWLEWVSKGLKSG